LLTIDAIIANIRAARFVWTCGNGGSAANAEHLASDLLACGVPAICLNSNHAALTAIANDYSYPSVFSYQLGIMGDPGDLLITISCSGSRRISWKLSIQPQDWDAGISVPAHGRQRLRARRR